MAIYKCKMCGGDLNIEADVNVVECEYCGTTQTVPTVDNEKKVNLFNRANRLRINGEFDKATGIYESIIAEFPEEAEAYWGLCLCNYGIEYVDDPATAKKVPTCHRASFDKLANDENFELAMEYADVVAQKVYRDEAREIDRIMEEILSISKNEKPYDVFICYKETDEKGGRTIDSVLAQDIYDALTSKGFKVFFARITLEDKLGQMYEPYIFAALNSAKVLLSVGTKYEYFHAVWVKNEWSRFLKLMARDKSKVLIPCYKDMDAYDLPDEFKALQAQDMGKIGFIQDLVRGVEKITGETEKFVIKEVSDNSAAVVSIDSLLKRAFMFLEDADWNSANEYCEKVLDVDPENGRAYLGKLMAELKVGQQEEIKYLRKPFDTSNNYLKIKRYGAKSLIDLLESYLDCIYKKKESARVAKRPCCKTLEEHRVNLSDDCKVTQNLVSAGTRHTVYLRSDGTVFAVGDESDGRCIVNHWKDIVAVSAGHKHTVGLKVDGTVVAVGNNDNGQCNVSHWKNIVAVSAGAKHTIGLKTDGSVVATGSNEQGECNVNSWTDIVSISAGSVCSVGLKSDGTVVATGSNKYGQCDVSDWEDIVAISSGNNHTVGLMSDGTVVAAGSDEFNKTNVGNWTNIVAVSAGWSHTVGLKSDGTVVAVGWNQLNQCNITTWKNIINVSAGRLHTIGLEASGMPVAAGNEQAGINNYAFFTFHFFPQEDNDVTVEKEKILENEEVAIARFWEEISNDKKMWREKGLCQYCGGSFKGIFTKKCSSCGRVKDY